MVVVFDDWQGHIFSGARSRRWRAERGSTGRQETSPSCGQICCHRRCCCCCCRHESYGQLLMISKVISFSLPCWWHSVSFRTCLALQNFFQRRDQEDDGERIARQARDQARHAEVVPLILFSCLALLNDFQRRDQEDDGERLARLADQMTRQARVRVLLFVFAHACRRCWSNQKNLAPESWS